MGKVFVKGPTESPDDLLKIESQLARAGRVGADFGLGAAKRFLGPQPKDFGSFMQQYFFDPIQYLREGRGKRQLTDEEKDEMRFRRRQKFREQLEEEKRPMVEEQKRIAERAKQTAADEALLGRFQNLTRRGNTLTDVAELTPYKGAQTLEEFQEYADNKFPGMSLNEVANLLGQQFTNLQGLDLRRRATGKDGLEFDTAKNEANQMIAVSDAAMPNVATTDLEPMNTNVKTTIDRNDANNRIREMAGLPKESEAPTPQISTADNAASVAASGGVNSSPHGAKKEDERDDAMATNSENMDFDNETGIERPELQPQEEEAGPAFDIGGPGNAPVSPPVNSPTGRAFESERLPDGSGRWEG